MSVRLGPYHKYKDSGVPWLGDVPEHWEVGKIKNLSRPGYKTFVDGDWIESPYITSDGIRLIQTGNIGIGAYREKGFRYISEKTLDAFGCTEFTPNDVLICRLGEPVGRACLAPLLGVRMITSVDVCILKPRDDVNAAFVVYAMSSPQYLGWVGSLVRGSTRDRVSRSMLGGFVLPLPPLPEQSAIVRFLAHADRRINRLIRAKQKLIKLLNEQKQAIIHQAVTRGLDPNVRLKPSGVEWLGDVPEHWEVKPLRFVGTKFGSGITPRGGASVYQEAGIPLLRSQNIHFGELRLDDVAFISVDIHTSMAGTHVRPGDVLLNITGASIGRVCSVPSTLAEANVNQHVCIIRPRKQRCTAEYLAAFLSTGFIQTEIYVSQNGASREGLSLKAVKALPVILPPVHEQKAIMGEIEGQTAEFTLATRAAVREIELLREYRTRLIADVVTGKLDVRGVELPALDEADALEDLDIGEDADAEEMADIKETADAGE